MNENMLYGSAYPFGGLKEGIRYSLDNYNFQDEQTKENYLTALFKICSKRQQQEDLHSQICTKSGSHRLSNRNYLCEYCCYVGNHLSYGRNYGIQKTR